MRPWSDWSSRRARAPTASSPGAAASGWGGGGGAARRPPHEWVWRLKEENKVVVIRVSWLGFVGLLMCAASRARVRATSRGLRLASLAEPTSPRLT